jgi:catechol 2,3-dioxygenase-like lactoylglutathione lyase family enzyme
MKRMHIGLKVDDLEEAVAFYSRLFGAEPTLERPDYAKWMLEDPRVNFSVDTHGDGPAGSAHYGIQVESAKELADLREHIDQADLARRDQNNLICGYQRQDKSWVNDPHGLQWEMFYTEGVVQGAGYGCDSVPDANGTA